MAKKAYIGVDGTARKVKKGYVGVSDIARKVKKAYIGVGGAARPCWSGGEMTYYGQVDSLSAGRWTCNPVSIGTYMLFPGGFTSYSAGVPTWSSVDCYDDAMIHTMAASLSTAKGGAPSARIGSHALIAGGACNGTYYTTVDAYDENLVRTSAPALNSTKGHTQDCAHNHLLAVFANNAGVDFYNADLTHTTAAAIVNASGSHTGEYAVFASTATYAFNGNGTLSRPAAMNTLRYYPTCGAMAAGRALFACGNKDGAYLANVETYDATLTLAVLESLPQGREAPGAANLGDGTIISGGWSGSAPIGTVYAYNDDLVRLTLPSVSAACVRFGTGTGETAIFAGGRTNWSVENNVVSAAYAYQLI